MQCKTATGSMGHKIGETQSKNLKSEDKTLKRRPFRYGQDRYMDYSHPHFIFVQMVLSEVSPKHQKYSILLPGQVADLVRFLTAYENTEICSIIIRICILYKHWEDSYVKIILVFLGYSDILFIFDHVLKQIEYIIILSKR